MPCHRLRLPGVHPNVDVSPPLLYGLSAAETSDMERIQKKQAAARRIALAYLEAAGAAVQAVAVQVDSWPASELQPSSA